MCVATGETVYLSPNPVGLGATVDDAMREHAGCRRVVVCGDQLGGGRRLREWVHAVGRWHHTVEPYTGVAALRASLGLDGHRVSVSRSAQWFDGASPAAVVEATKHVRHAVALTGASMVGSPSRTGLGMLHALWRKRGHDYPPAPAEVQQLLRSTSGQGRFELFDRAARGGRTLYAVDARFQYAALAGRELPVGEPVELAGGEPDEYAAAWVHVAFTPPDDGPPFGLLAVPVDDRGRRSWWWPASGEHETWCTWLEVHQARRAGYRVRVLAGVVWPSKARPLSTWAAHLIRERDRMLSLPIDDETRDAVRAALRNVTIQTVGIMHGRDARAVHVATDSRQIADDAVEIRRLGPDRWEYVTLVPAEHRAADSHPEWTATLWGFARARLNEQMMRQKPGSLVGCALDAFYTSSRPVVDDDTGRAGVWRSAGSYGRWPALSSMHDLYRVTR